MANTSIYGLYATRASVEIAVDRLRNAGFRSTDISILLPQNIGNKEIAVQNQTKAPEGIATGATGGAVIGGALGWLVGIGALAIPGVGPFIAAGPIVASLAGAAAGAALGGVTGALIGLGMPEYEAKRYEGKMKEGRVLLSVHTDDSTERDRAKTIFE